MKHILLGTTALVAAGLVAGPVSAQEGVKLGVGGFYFGAAGGLLDESFDNSTQDEDNFDDYDFKQNVEVHFKGETTLDNGLTVGARVELEGQEQGGNDYLDEVYAYFSGGFGELRFGDDDDAYGHLCYLVPTASAAFGADSPFINFSNAGTNGTCYGMSGNSTKLIYFSPSFGGFQLAASYAPDDNENTGSNVSGTASDIDGDIENIFGVAATYAADVDGFSVAVGGGASFGSREDIGPNIDNPVDDPTFYNGYAQVGFAGWTIGASTELRQDTRLDGDDWVYGVGATYGFQAWTVGLGWTHGDYETVGGDDEDTLDIVQFTAAYALGPGVTLDAMAGWNKGDAADGEEYEAIEAGVGFGLSF